jgi:hypothetical protein
VEEKLISAYVAGHALDKIGSDLGLAALAGKRKERLRNAKDRPIGVGRPF